MANPFVDVIGHFYPLVQCHAFGDSYSDIVYDCGDAIPPETELLPLILEFKKLRKWEEIKAYRDWRLEYGGYPTSVGWFHSDAPSRGNYIAADRQTNRAVLQALQDAGTPKMWKTMAGTWTYLTIPVLNELLASEVTQKDNHFYRAEMIKIALWMSDDPDNFDYKQNAEKNRWPLIYGE